MLTAYRSLSLHSQAAPELPRIEALEGLYLNGVKFRQGQTIMVAGRPGAGKSAFALWLAVQWNMKTLYCSADMSGFDASTRVASMLTGLTTEQVEDALAAENEDEKKKLILDAIAGINITFSHDAPITWTGLDAELMAYVELHNAYPELIVIDNLMDVEGCDTEHAMQMSAMQEFVSMARNTGATVVVLHHAQENANTNVTQPPSRGEIANKVTQKPEMVLTVAMNPTEAQPQFRVACVKQRGGKADPSGTNYTTLRSFPDRNQFARFTIGRL